MFHKHNSGPIMGLNSMSKAIFYYFKKTGRHTDMYESEKINKTTILLDR